MPNSFSIISIRRGVLNVVGAVVAVWMAGVVNATAETVSVQVEATKLRGAPRQFAPSTATLAFGDSLTVTSRDKDWYQVTLADGRTGFVHESAVTGKRIVLSSRQVTLADVAVDESQVYLAGKGFNGTVESSYAASDREANYAALRRMKSTRTVSDDKALTFIKTGKLVGPQS